MGGRHKAACKRQTKSNGNLSNLLSDHAPPSPWSAGQHALLRYAKEVPRCLRVVPAACYVKPRSKKVRRRRSTAPTKTTCWRTEEAVFAWWRG